MYILFCRNAATGFILIFDRLGGIVAPQIVNLDSFSPDAQYIAFGVLGIASGLVTLLLRETRGMQLPNHIEDLYGDGPKTSDSTSKSDYQQLSCPDDEDSDTRNYGHYEVHRRLT